MKHDVTITGLRRVRHLKPTEKGNTELAYFDCEVGGLLMVGCVLVMLGRGELTAWPPKVDSSKTVARGVRFIDTGLRNAVLKEVLKHYKAMGGQVPGKQDNHGRSLGEILGEAIETKRRAEAAVA